MQRNRLLILMALIMILGLYEIAKADEAYYFEKEEDGFMCFYIRRYKNNKLLCIGKGSSRRQALKDARSKAERIRRISENKEPLIRIE